MLISDLIAIFVDHCQSSQPMGSQTIDNAIKHLFTQNFNEYSADSLDSYETYEQLFYAIID